METVEQGRVRPRRSREAPIACALALIALSGIAVAACGGSSRPVKATADPRRAGGLVLGATRKGAVRYQRSGHALGGQALAKFALCLRDDGLDVRVAYPRGELEKLEMGTVAMQSNRVKTAWARCRGEVDLGASFSRTRGGGGAAAQGALE